MDFCGRCGQRTDRRVPDGDDRERRVCGACGVVHYDNPRMVVGCIVEHEGRILLCKRAIEPRRGYWTIPAGYLELGESAMAGATRETYEEALARVEIIAPYSHFDIPQIGQAYIVYRARMLSPDFAPGPESLDVALVAPDAIPWSELAFNAVRYSLELLCEDLAAGAYRQHHGVVTRSEAGDYTLSKHLAVRLA